jgi:hypothetical protein
MEWEIILGGPEPVLEEFTHAFRDPSTRIVRTGDGFVLKVATFADLADARDVRERATPIVESLSGIARLLLQNEESLRIASVVEIRPNGTRNIFVELEPAVLRITAGLVVSLQVSRADGSIEERRPSDPAPAWLVKALDTPEAARALRLRDKRDLSWTDLYRLFEVVVGGAGGTEVIINEGWASRGQLSRFTHSANSVSAAGDLARHGVERNAPPADPMSISEARSLVDILLSRWLGKGAV